MSEKIVIKVDQISKVYGMGDIAIEALKGVDLQINENEFVAVMGPSGSGKSTLMNILGCLDRPTKGKYHLNGINVSDLTKTELAVIRNENIGFVFQAYNLLARTSALENVMLPMLYNRSNAFPENEQKDIAMAALDQVGLADRVHHLPQELSGGQMQRVAIARALVNNPVLVLADEPTGNLDSKSSVDIMNLLLDLHDEGRTIVMVTHEDDVAAYAERVIRFKDGEIDTDKLNGKRQVKSKLKGDSE